MIADALMTIVCTALFVSGYFGLLHSFHKAADQREREKAQEAAARQLASSSRFCNPDIAWLEAHIAHAEPMDAAAIERGVFIEQARWDR